MGNWEYLLYGLALIGIGSIVYILCDFIQYVFNGSRFVTRLRRPIEGFVLVIPAFILLFDIGMSYNSCSYTAITSPSDHLSLVVLVLLNLLAYFYFSYRKQVSSPLIEIVANCCLLLGLPLIVYVCLQIRGELVWFVLWLPLTLLILMALAENHTLVLESLQEQENEDKGLLKVCRKIVLLPSFIKFPLLVILCLPILMILIN